MQKRISVIIGLLLYVTLCGATTIPTAFSPLGVTGFTKSYVTQGLVSWLDPDSGYDENGLWLDMIEHDPEYPDADSGTHPFMVPGEAAYASYSTGEQGVTFTRGYDSGLYTHRRRLGNRVSRRFNENKAMTAEICVTSSAHDNPHHSAPYSTPIVGDGINLAPRLYSAAVRRGGVNRNLGKPPVWDGKVHTYTITLGTNSIEGVYVDGQPAEGVTGYPYELPDSTGNYTHSILGGDNAPQRRGYLGTIHNVRVYNRELTAEEVRRNWEVDQRRFTGTLVGADIFYVFNDEQLQGTCAGNIPEIDPDTQPIIDITTTKDLPTWLVYRLIDQDGTTPVEALPVVGSAGEYQITMPDIPQDTKVQYRIVRGDDPQFPDEAWPNENSWYSYSIPMYVEFNGVRVTADAVPETAYDDPLVITTNLQGSNVWVRVKSGTSTLCLEMEKSGVLAQVVMPVLPVGEVSYRVEAGEEFGVATEALPGMASFYSYENIEELSDLRKPDLGFWYSQFGHVVPPATHTYNYGDWSVVSVTMFSSDYSVNLKALETEGRESNDPSLRTRTAANAGSIWFKARFLGSAGTGTLVIEKSLNSRANQPHDLVAEVQVPYVSGWTLFRIDINSEEEAYYRIRHPSGVDMEGDNIAIKEIVITPLSADVVVEKELVEFTPGYPSRHDPTVFTITASNKYDTVPASNIAPKLIWRLNRGAWNETDMANTTGDEYSATLPPMVTHGELEYYYITPFSGYASGVPTHYPPWNQSNTPVVNFDDFSTLLDDGFMSDTRSPRHLPSCDNDQLYDYSVSPPTNINDNSVLPDWGGYYSIDITE